jgi:hypothetical protein
VLPGPAQPVREHQSPPPPQLRGPSRPPERLLGDLSHSLGEVLGGVTRHFSLGDVDTGDILLVLIILFLFLEGDDLELVITLGLMLLLGLGED